jgi:hypothetical protein
VRWIDDRCYEFTVGFHPGFLATQLDVYLGMTTLLHTLYAVFDAMAAVALKLYERGFTLFYATRRQSKSLPFIVAAR